MGYNNRFGPELCIFRELLLLHLELIRRKFANHTALFYKPVKLIEGVAADGSVVLDFGELAGVPVVNEAVRVIVDHSADIIESGEQVVIAQF